MRRELIYVLVLTIVLAGCHGPPAPLYSVSGKVLDENGVGMEGVSVIITGQRNITVRTNEDGYWEAGGLRGRVAITPMAEEETLWPESYVTSSGGSNFNFGHRTFNLNGDWVVEWVEGSVSGSLRVIEVGGNYERTYYAKLSVVNNSSVEGVIYYQTVVADTDSGARDGWRIPPDGRVWQKTFAMATYRSPNLGDHIYDSFHVVVEGLIDGMAVRYELPFTGWPD